MSNDASKLSIPLILALSAIAPCIIIGISYGAQTTALTNVRDDITQLQTEQMKINSMALQIARLETKIDFLVAKENSKP